MLEFFDSNEQKGFVSIYDSHFTFNKGLLNYFKDTYRVRVGIDRDERKIYVFLMNKDYCMSNEFQETSLLPISMAKTYARVCSSSLVNYVTNSFSLTIPRGKYLRYKANYDEKKRAIIINLEEEV